MTQIKMKGNIIMYMKILQKKSQNEKNDGKNTEERKTQKLGLTITNNAHLFSTK